MGTRYRYMDDELGTTHEFDQVKVNYFQIVQDSYDYTYFIFLTLLLSVPVRVMRRVPC